MEARRESVAIASWWTPMKMGAVRRACGTLASWQRQHGACARPNRRHAAPCALVNGREGGDQAVSTRHDCGGGEAAAERYEFPFNSASRSGRVERRFYPFQFNSLTLPLELPVRGAQIDVQDLYVC